MIGNIENDKDRPHYDEESGRYRRIEQRRGGDGHAGDNEPVHHGDETDGVFGVVHGNNADFRAVSDSRGFHYGFARRPQMVRDILFLHCQGGILGNGYFTRDIETIKFHGAVQRAVQRRNETGQINAGSHYADGFAVFKDRGIHPEVCGMEIRIIVDVEVVPIRFVEGHIVPIVFGRARIDRIWLGIVEIEQLVRIAHPENRVVPEIPAICGQRLKSQFPQRRIGRVYKVTLYQGIVRQFD
ncbi:MAG: hypothetical protein LBD06_03080, partial [Candidatus Accumulibacter sp.]|nr:hypothetical protein [Accumulibacter sp.]